MNPSLIFRGTLVAIVATAGQTRATEPFTVHEWGTFTTVSGSDGALLPGLEREEQPLPPFVHSHAGFSPANKGWDRPVSNVTVKMETPVIYFYAAQPITVTVDVAFHGGSISQWYPERSGGETLPPIPEAVIADQARAKSVRPVDFAAGFNGSASWRIDVLDAAASEPFSASREWETAQWSRARVAGANKVRGPDGVEGFIFYRGIGNFGIPLETQIRGGNLLLKNRGAEKIPFVFVYEKRAAFPSGVVWWSGALDAGGEKFVPLMRSWGDLAAEPVMSGKFPRALEAAGLTEEEAKALLATWRESYFEREGVRVFWIVPRAFTDRVLPMTLTPRPLRLERVLVGRSEVLTPDFERELVQEFAANAGKRWEADRSFLAYQARARQLGVVSSAIPPKTKP